MIYLDNAATTKPNIQILNNSLEFATENYYNPSALYRGGLAVSEKIKNARNELLKYFSGYKVIFTSCGTESDNTAVFGFAKRGNVVTTEGEHSAIFQSFETLRQKGMDVRFAKLNRDGSVNEESLFSLIDENTSFLSLVHVNNETGAINDINAIAKRAKAVSPRIIVHSDGVQAFGKLPFKLDGSVDLYSASSHKIGGLKGIGALFYRENLHLPPYIIGGGQEEGLRSGTENVVGILDFCECAKTALANVCDNLKKVSELKQAFLQILDTQKITVVSSETASPYVISVLSSGLRGEVIQHMMEEFGIIVGTGSACSSRHPHSRVLKACGYSSKQLDGVIRISFIFDSEKRDVEFCAQKLNECVSKLSGIIFR